MKKALAEERKENETIINATYLMCSLRDVDVALEEGYDYYVIQNDISGIYNPVYEYASTNDNVSLIDEALEIHNEGYNYGYQVVFLLLESFGSHNMDNLCIDTIILKYDENMEYEDLRIPRFGDLPQASIETEYIFELKDRKAGEKLLLPLLIKYDNFQGDNEEDPNAYHTFVYKEVYKPVLIRYEDSVTGEEKEVQVRDILNDHIEIDMHYVGLG